MSSTYNINIKSMASVIVIIAAYMIIMRHDDTINKGMSQQVLPDIEKRSGYKYTTTNTIESDITDSNNLFPVISNNHAEIKKKYNSRYLECSSLYSALESEIRSNTMMSGLNWHDINKCPDHEYFIQKQILHGSLTGTQAKKLLEWLSLENHHEPAIMLADIANRTISQNGINDTAAAIMESIISLNSTNTSIQFIDYILENQSIPFELEDAIIKGINNTSDRQQIGTAIFDRFTSTTDPSEQEILMSIGQPESLIKIAAMAMENGDKNLYHEATNHLANSPSQFTFDALLLGIEYSKNYDTNVQSSIIELAQQWAHHQLSGSRLDWVDERLASNTLSYQDRQAALSILEHSEDQIHSRDIIYKYWTYR